MKSEGQEADTQEQRVNVRERESKKEMGIQVPVGERLM